MSENKNMGKSQKAQELLTRLNKNKSEEKGAPAEKKNASYYDFITEREKNKPADAPAAFEEALEETVVAEDDEFDAIYDEIYAEMELEETAQAVLEETEEESVVIPEEELVEEILVEEEILEEEVLEEEILDEYSEYFAEEEFADPVAPATMSVPAVSASNEIAEAEVIEYYDDIIPDDDFFDNDPIEDGEVVEEEQYYEDDEEYDEERDFENLVAEVTGGASVDDLDETDISLMVALGMEDELAKSVGEETAAQITDDYVADQEEWVDRTNRFGADEYSDPQQNAQIAREYTKRNRISFWKMIGALLICVSMFFFENLEMLNYQFTGALNPSNYPVVYIMIDLQITLFAVALVFPRVVNGLKSLISFRPSVDCFPALLSCAAIVNSVVLAYNSADFMKSGADAEKPVLFNFVCVLCLFFTALNDYMTVRREIFSFNIVSSKRPKFVMRRLSQRDSVMETEAVAQMDPTAADEGDIIKIQKTDFVDGYFWRTKIKSVVGRPIIGLSVVISLVLAVIVAIYAASQDMVAPVNIGFAVLCAAAPASMVISGFYPFYRANRRAYDNDCTIIGEGSVDEYSGVGVISFDDVNVFPSYSVKVRNVRLFNNSRIDKVLYYAASVFSATGGPLADVFEVATMETGHSDNVKILETGSGYIEAEVNGRSIMFGKSEALATRGIIIPDDVIGESAEIPADCSVMYMIYQHKLVAKMIVNYVLDSDFEYVLKQLTGSGMCVCVKTFDPNIDEELICRQIPQGRYSMRVIKYRNTEEITKYSKHAEGGVVSRGNTKSLLKTVSNCDKIISAQKTGFAIGVISSVLNAAIIAFALVFASFSGMFSFYVALCQLFWLLPVVITTKLIVR